MNRTLYRILVYTCLGLFIGSIIGLVFSLKGSSAFNSNAILCLCLRICSPICLVVVQCLYRMLKKPLPKGDQTKVCPNCQGINDKDAEYCKYCGNKFRNF